MTGVKGIKHSKESYIKQGNTLKKLYREKIIIPYRKGKVGTFKGKHHTKKTKNKIRDTLLKNYKKENHYNWKGGISNEEYDDNFNNKLKTKIRKRDKYICKICGIKQKYLKDKNNKKYSLIVHHIDFNKKNSSMNNLISLCRKCHIKLHNKKIKNVIISGHKGLIGINLLKRLRKENYNISYRIDLRDGFNLQNLDSLKLSSNKEKIDLFIHSAAYSKIAESIKNPKLVFENNIRGTFEVLEFCRNNNIKKVVIFSSSRVLSKEENVYTVSKKVGELLCEAYKQCYDINYIIIRPSTVYGTEVYDKTSRLLTEWIPKAINKKKLIIYGYKDKTLDFTYIDDFVDGLMILIKNWDITKNKSYNISGNKEEKLIKIIQLIQKELKYKVNYKFDNPEIAQPQRVKIDISEMKKLGFNPKINIEEGIKRMINWYKKNE